MNKNAVINIRISSTDKDKFSLISSTEGFDASKVIHAFIEMVNENGLLPEEIKQRLTPRAPEDILSIHYIKTMVSSYLKERKDLLIEKVYLFGSYARSEETPFSNIDFHLEVSDGFDLFDLGSFKEDMSSLLRKEVSAVLGDNLSPIYLDDIRKDEICIYERGRQ